MSIELPLGLYGDANGLTMTNDIYIDTKPDSYTHAESGRQVQTRADCVARFPMLATGQGA